MGVSLTKKAADHSSRESFHFSFYCDRCKKRWKSEVIPFSGSTNVKIDNDEVRKILWEREHRVAFERANLEAQFHFNHCPVCKRWVCDDCFWVDDGINGGIGICRDCGKKAGIKGYTIAEFNKAWPEIEKQRNQADIDNKNREQP